MEHDWHVGGVKQSDWVDVERASLSRGLDWQVDSETLKVDDEGEDNKGGEDLRHVWGVVSVEGVDKSSPGAGSGKEHVDEGQDGALELRASTSVDQSWSEALPDDGLADLRGHEQGGA